MDDPTPLPPARDASPRRLLRFAALLALRATWGAAAAEGILERLGLSDADGRGSDRADRDPHPDAPDDLDPTHQTRFAAGSIRLGGQLSLSYADAAQADGALASTLLSFSVAPTFGYLVLDWLELGLELGLGVGQRETTVDQPLLGAVTETTDSLAFSFLPAVRFHVGLTDHVLIGLGALLGYATESVEASGRPETSTGGFSAALEAALEVAVDGILIPVWIRFLYQLWTTEVGGSEADLDVYTVAFGTGIHAYF